LGKKGHAEGQFQSPEGITSGPGPDGKDDETFLYVCDTGNDRVQASTVLAFWIAASYTSC
jgi:hypothetical protein